MTQIGDGNGAKGEKVMRREETRREGEGRTASVEDGWWGIGATWAFVVVKEHAETTQLQKDRPNAEQYGHSDATRVHR